MDKSRNPLIRAMVFLALFIWILVCLVPFAWAILNSIKYPIDANMPVPEFWGFPTTGSNYSDLWLYMPAAQFMPIGLGILAVIFLLCLFYFVNRWRNFVSKTASGIVIIVVLVAMALLIPSVAKVSKFYDYFINSVIVTCGTLIISIGIGCLGGYGLARYSGIWGVIILVAALAFRALPRMAFVLPYFYLAQATKLYDTHFILIITLVAINQPFTIWMLRSFFMDIPRELEEAAMIDGAGRLRSFVQVILPIAVPGIVTTSLFTMLLSYNEFLLPRVLMQAHLTMPVAIASYTSGEDASYRTIAAAAAVSITLPIMVIISIFQKHLVKGLAQGAVKG